MIGAILVSGRAFRYFPITMANLPHIFPPTFEHHPDGLGIAHTRPRLSWRFSSDDDGVSPSIQESWYQTAYDIEISGPVSKDTKVFHISSTESVLVAWPAKPLKSRDVASVRVRSYADVNGKPLVTEWSPWATCEVALLDRQDWSSSFITSTTRFQAEEGGALRPIRFRKEFDIPDLKTVAKARLYVTSLGVYNAYINGTQAGDHVMAPGWTSYNHRLNYQVFDVTPSLKESNALSVEVGEGWYAGRLGFHGGKRFIYGDDLAVLAQLEVTLETGETLKIETDDSWKCHPSSMISSEIYDGELLDMREEQIGWKDPAFDATSWTTTKILPFISARLNAPDAPPVRKTEERLPIDIIKSKSGKTILDFGQNLVGVISIRSLKAPAGHKVSFTYTEVLENGEVATRPLRICKSIDAVISSGEVLENWSPKFTFHGFRYVQVDGWPGDPSRDDFKAQVLHCDMKRRGWFSCSNPLVNKLHENVVWSMRGNFLSIPTDCPQRKWTSSYIQSMWNTADTQ